MATKASTAKSNYFEAIYLKKHPKKFDAQRAALLKRLKARKKKGTKK